MDHEEDKGAPTMKEAGMEDRKKALLASAWEHDDDDLCATCGKTWGLHFGRCCDSEETDRRWSAASPTGVTADARLPIGDEIRQLCALRDREAITANLLRFGGLNKHHARAVAEVMLRADDFKPWNDERATQCNEGTRSVEAGTSVLEQQERDADGVEGTRNG